MPNRRLPSAEETLRILAQKRTRPALRSPPPVGRKLTPIIKALNDKFGKTEGALHARWREIVGDALAAHSEPIKIVRNRAGAGGALQIKVAGAVAALVQHQAPDILARANLVLGPGTVDKLRIIQGPVRPAARVLDTGAAVRARRQTVKPLDAADEARLEAGLAEAPEGRMKAALRTLGREVLRRNGGD
jgi:hypothetical protein